MIACTADGRKLPPLIIFKKKTLPKEDFPPPNCSAQRKGFMNESLMLEWIRRVWNQRPGALFQRPTMLVLDSVWGHLTANVKWALCDGKTDLVVITGGLTSVLQPLEVVLNKPFKDRLRELYNEWMMATTRGTPLAGCNDRRFQQFAVGCRQRGSRSPRKWFPNHSKIAA